MIKVRKANERGHAAHGWLETYHTFSFSSYYDPQHTRFRSLRVINEDWIEGGKGFGTHPHQDMEIITYIIEGELEHRDSMGNGSVIRPGELQRMTAGTGITHSEFNPAHNRTHLLQIWIRPETTGLPPGYEQRQFPELMKPNTLTLLASRNGENGSLTVHQNAEIHGGRLESGAAMEYAVAPGRHVWIQLIHGVLDVNGVELVAGDGASVSDKTSITLSAKAPCEFLLFNLA